MKCNNFRYVNSMIWKTGKEFSCENCGNRRFKKWKKN